MITSYDNKGVKEVAALEQKARTRREKGLFVAEGVKMFLEAPVERIRRVYLSESFYNKMLPECEARLELILSHYEIVSDGVFEKMADTKTPQGILCLVQTVQYDLSNMLNAAAPLLVILEDIRDAGNLGTIFRSAEGAGVSGIIMNKGSADIYNPKAVRSTMGSVYRVPFLYTEETDKIIEKLRGRNITVYAAQLDGAVPYDVCDYREGSAFFIGNEARGLKKESAARCDVKIRIPMLGEVESLNAAMSCGILLYEAARQRRR